MKAMNFCGWYTQKTGGDEVELDKFIPTESITLYARWKKLQEDKIEPETGIDLEKLIIVAKNSESISYTYDGDAIPTVETSASSIATATIDRTNKKVNIAAVSAGEAIVTINFPEGTNYSAGTPITIKVTVTAANYSIGTTYYTTLEDAVAGAKDEDEINVLTNNMTEPAITIDKNIKLNLNTKTLTMSGAITVNSGCTLEFTETGTIQRSTGELITNSGTVTVNGPTLTSTDYTINGGTVNVKSGNVYGDISGINFNEGNSGNATITGGTLEGGEYGIYNKGTGTVTIGDGTISINTTSPIISGRICGIYSPETGTVNFNNGVIKGKNSIPYSVSGTLNKRAEIYTYYNPNESKFNSVLSSQTMNYSITTSGFDVGYASTLKNATETADVGLSSTNNSIINALVDEINDTSQVINTKDIVLNLNEKNITRNQTITNNNKLTINGEGVLTTGSTEALTNSGTLQIYNGTITGGRVGLYNLSGGTVTITGGTLKGVNENAIYNNGQIQIGGTAKVNCSSSSASGLYNTGTLNVTGGEIASDNTWSVYNLSGGTTTITGGEITCENNTALVNKGTLTVGVNNGDVDITTPSIIGAGYGIQSNEGSFYFYDGAVKGPAMKSTSATPYRAIYGEIAGKPDGYGVYNLVSGDIETATLKEGLILNYDAQAYTATEFSQTATSWYDRSGNGKHGTLTNFANTTSSGWLAYNSRTNGLVFDGSNDWVNTGIIDTAAVKNRTFAATFKATTVTASANVISNTETGGCGIYINSSKYLCSSLYMSGAYKYCTSSTVATANKTYMVVMTFDGTNERFYINGSQAKYTSASGSIAVPQSNTVIGLGTNPVGSSHATSSMLKGVIYSAHVFDKALTAAEVTELYNSEVARGR